MEKINLKKYDKFSNDELELEFYKASKNDDFKNIVNNLNIGEKELMKYTTKLLQCSKEKSNCKNCKGIETCKNEIAGFVFTPKAVDNELIFSYDLCKIKSKQLEEIEYMKNGYMFEVSKNIRNAKMKDIYTDDKNRVEVIKWLTSFIKNYKNGDAHKGLYLSGNFGSGKSYLVSATMNELAKSGYKVAMIYYPEFLRSLKASFKTDFDEQFEYARKSDLLLLDDIGAESISSWSRDEILGPILQYRMDEKLPTFFTSNLSIEELEVHLSEGKDKVDRLKAKRIIERIKYLTDDIKLISKNNRV